MKRLKQETGTGRTSRGYSFNGKAFQITYMKIVEFFKKRKMSTFYILDDGNCEIVKSCSELLMSTPKSDRL